jgi:hypothetical protein
MAKPNHDRRAEGERICARPGDGEDPPPGAIRIPPVRDIEPDDFADGIVDFVNRWRTGQGLPPMVEDDATKKRATDAPPPSDKP